VSFADRDPVGALRPYAGHPCLLYAASRTLSGAESAQLLEALDGFLDGWASHGAPVAGGGALLENRFVIVAHRPAEIAGCSRDALQFFLKDAAARLGVEWVGGSRVFYRAGDDAGNIVADLDRPGFRALAASGAVTADTVVFDTTLRETDAVLAGRLAVPARDSWHAKLMAG
jgi:hypothetical protein